VERVKDLKKYLKLREKLSVTEAEILSQAFEMAFEHQEELVKRLKKRRNSEFWEFWMTPVEGGSSHRCGKRPRSAMILVDSSIWDAAKRRRDKSHAVAREVLQEIMEGKYGRVVITDYIIDEVVTWLNAHTTHKIAVQTADFFFTSKEIEIEKIDWAASRLRFGKR
jgi:hypothetical protein